MKFWQIQIWMIIALCVCVSACGQAEHDADSLKLASKGRPNIVFILVDDMGFGDPGYNGSEIATPTLDMIAQNGVILDRNYVYPICSPTRAALLTGRSPLEFGIDGPMADDAHLPLDLKTMPEYFKDLGYQTHMVGKWHLGIAKPEYYPQARGFDTFYGFLGGWIDYYTHVYSGGDRYDGGLDWQRNGVSMREDGHSTDLFSEEAERLIVGREKDKPFFLYLSYNSPHTPLQLLDEKTGLNESIPMGDRYVYAEMLTHADHGIGKVISALRMEGILDNTIIVFSSDNGGLLTGGASNGELRGSKGGGLEGGMRVPGLIWWPGHVEGGHKLEQMIAVHDWLPTLLDGIGGMPEDIEAAYGQNMWPALAHGQEIERAPTVIGVNKNAGVFDGPWKYTLHTERGPNGKRTVELFNILEDPFETTDLSSEMPDVFARLEQIYEDLPKAPSLRDSGPPPERYFTKENSPDKDYKMRLQETRQPWASSTQ